jgi:hypothetical protein
LSSKKDKKSVEYKIKQALNIPERVRVISLLPVGVPAYSTEKERKPLEEICSINVYSRRQLRVGVDDQSKKIKMEATRHGMKSKLPPITPS